MLKVTSRSWYLVFLINSLVGCFGASSLKEVGQTTTTIQTTNEAGRDQLVAASNHFSSVHKIRFDL